MATARKPMSKQERRDAAREEALRIREEQERRDKRNRMIMIAGVVALVVVAALAVAAIFANQNKSPFEGVAQPAGAVDGGIPIGTSLIAGEEGKGVRLDVYLDYTCSWCKVFEETYSDYLREASQAGEVAVWYHPVSQMDPTGDFSGFSGLATNASATVAQHAPDKFLDFHVKLFEAGTGAAGLPEIEAAAAAAGVPDDVIARFAAGEFRAFTAATTANFLANVSQGTPAIFLAGEKFTDNWTQDGVLQAAIAALSGK